MTGDQIAVTNALKIQGLSFRHFRGESDYSPIAAVLMGSSAADRIDRNVSVEDISAVYGKYLSNCDPYADLIFAEVNGEVVGYARGWWTEEPPYMWLYKHNGFLLAPYRREGIGLILLHWMENHLKDIARTHPPELKNNCGRPFGRLINASPDATCYQEQVFSPWRFREPSNSGLVSFQGT